jgi:hypothetical protein
MNCRRVQDLIPLYVGGDLKEGRALEVSSHLNSCELCKSVMDEFTESQQWARASSEPDFDEAFFDDLRESVFARIESPAARPSFFQLLKERMLLKPAFALTVALLLIIAGMAFYIYSGKTKNDLRKEPVARGNENKEEKQEEQTATPHEKEEKGFKRHRINRPRQQQPDSMMAKVRRDVELMEPMTEPQFVSDNTDSTRFEGQTDERTNPTEGMTRIEFRTSDPNIRIIWFAPKEKDSKQSKPITD